MAAGPPPSPGRNDSPPQERAGARQRPLTLPKGGNRWLSTLDPSERYNLAQFLADQSWLSSLPSVRISSRGVSSLRADKAQNPLLNYTFLRPLGKGRFGTVGLYRHRSGVDYAIKQVSLSPYSFDEFRALIASCRHRARMVDLKKIFVADNRVFLVMEPLARELTPGEFKQLPYDMRHRELLEMTLATGHFEATQAVNHSPAS